MVPSRPCQTASEARPRRYPFCRRLGRWDAVDGDAVHGRVGTGRQRYRNTARLSRGNPRTPGHARRGQRLSAEFFKQRDFHRRRRAQRAGRDESRGAAGQHRGCPAQRRHHRGPRSVHRVQHQARRLQDQSAHRSFARQIPGDRSRRDQAHLAGRARDGAEQSRGVPMPQHVRARDAVVAVSAADREHAQLPREPFQEDARDSRGERQGAQGRLQLRRDDRDVRELLRSAGGANRAGTVSQYHRQQRDRAGIRGGGREIGTSAVPRLVSDHARQRHPARTRRLQEFPRVYFPGRGRDRRRMRGDWRVVRRCDRDHHDLRPRHEPEGRGGRSRGQGRAAAGHHRHPARGSVDRHADQARAGRLAAVDVRTAWRVADSDYRGVDAGRLLRLRVRGGSHRRQVHDAGHPAHRRPARQRRRAVAAARRRQAARNQS